MKKFFFTCIIALVSFPVLLMAQEKETIVQIKTSLGKIKVKLYNDTPQHRDNFIKLVENKTFDGLIFHRVIKQFVVQAGDLKGKDSPIGEKLGDNDLDYTIPAEILYPKYFHKRGALCAARTPNDVNPEKKSSPNQFYIVTGKFFTSMELDKKEKERGRTFTPEEREAYMLQGGTPQLDGEYTVFGEVIKGQKIVDEIEVVQTDENDRPSKKNIVIKSMEIVKK